MKIKKVPTETPINFQPITIQITIETEEELSILYNMTQYNSTIPEIVSGDIIQQEIICNFLDSIRYELSKNGK